MQETVTEVDEHMDARKKSPMKISQEEIIKVLKSHGKYISPKEWVNSGASPSYTTITDRFGDWRTAWTQAGFDVPSNSPNMKFTDQEILDLLRAQGAFMTAAAWDEKFNREPSSNLIASRFSGWIKAWRAAGYDIQKRTNQRLNRPSDNYEWTKDAVILALQSHASFIPAKKWMEMRLQPSYATVNLLFGSWQEAWNAAKVDKPKVFTKEQMIPVLKQYNRMVSIKEWNEAHPGVPYSDVVQTFGSWETAWEVAGMQGLRPKWTTEDLVQLMQEQGHRTTMKEWSNIIKSPTPATIIKRFGSWEFAWEMVGL